MAQHGGDATPNYPAQLHHIKALYLQQRYRQCIQACRDLIRASHVDAQDRPLQQTFLNFYLGLAHDELARLMHDCSHAKMPAFKQAEMCYQLAIDALPTTPAALERLFDRPGPTSHYESPLNSTPVTAPAETRSFSDEYDPYNYSSRPARTRSTPIARPSRSSAAYLPTLSPSASVVVRDSDSSDFESYSSFHQNMTPHKTLQRDISRMSLLDGLTQPFTTSSHPSTNTRRDAPKSISGNMLQGPMRPLRPGDPFQAFHVPPRLPYAGNVSASAATARLPKLVTARPDGSSLRRPAYKSSYAHGASSPVSPLTPTVDENDESDDGSVSPVSPDMPPQREYWVRTTSLGLQKDLAENMNSQAEQESAAQLQQPEFGTGGYVRLVEHLDAMRTQLETHLRLLDEAKKRTLEIQAARTTVTRTPKSASTSANIDGHSRPSSSDSKHDSVLSGTRDSIQSGQKSLPQTRSFWSFTPQDVKINDKRKRIETGRKRKWARKRFDGTKYEMLVETALAEL